MGGKSSYFLCFFQTSEHKSLSVISFKLTNSFHIYSLKGVNEHAAAVK